MYRPRKAWNSSLHKYKIKLQHGGWGVAQWLENLGKVHASMGEATALQNDQSNMINFFLRLIVHFFY
jgi:hypothetical protein